MGEDAERQMAMRGESRVNNKDIGTDNAASKGRFAQRPFLSTRVGIHTFILLAKSESPVSDQRVNQAGPFSSEWPVTRVLLKSLMFFSF